MSEEKPKPVPVPNEDKNIKLPIIIHREGCWFFDRECLYPKSDIELKVEIHNELLTLGDYDKYESPFDSPYDLDVICTIPFPVEGRWCEMCLEAIKLRRETDLNYGVSRRALDSSCKEEVTN